MRPRVIGMTEVKVLLFLSHYRVGTCFLPPPLHPLNLPLTHHSQSADSLFAFHDRHLHDFPSLFVVAEYIFLLLNCVSWQYLVCLFSFYENFLSCHNLPMIESYGYANSCRHCPQHGLQSACWKFAFPSGFFPLRLNPPPWAASYKVWWRSFLWNIFSVVQKVSFVVKRTWVKYAEEPL